MLIKNSQISANYFAVVKEKNERTQGMRKAEASQMCLQITIIRDPASGWLCFWLGFPFFLDFPSN